MGVHKMTIARKAAKNSIYLLIANVISGILIIILTILAARYLGDVAFGIYSFALALAGLLVIISNIGLNLVVTRDLARNKDSTGKYLANATLIEISLSIIFFLSVFLVLNLINYPEDGKLVVYLVSLAVLFEQTFIMLQNSIYRSYGKMIYESLNLIIVKSIFFILGIYVLYSGYGLIPFVLMYFLASLIGFIVALIITLKKFTLPKFEIDFKTWKYLIITALPFGLAGMLNLIYARFDMIILSILKGAAVTGWYGAANTLVGSLSFINVAFITVIFPLMSNAFISSKELLNNVYEKSLKYSIIFLIPLAFGVMFLSDKIITVFFGQEFIQSAIILKILIWGGIIAFINSIFYTVLGSTNRQKITSVIMGIGVFVNVSLNLILIPNFSYIGAAVAAVLTQVVCLIFAVHFQSSYLSQLKLKGTLIKSTAASLCMSAIIFYFIYLNLFLLIFIASIIYLAVFVLLKGFNDDDWELFKGLIKSNK